MHKICLLLCLIPTLLFANPLTEESLKNLKYEETVVIPKSAKSNKPFTVPGNGLCLASTKFSTSNKLITPLEAENLLDKKINTNIKIRDVDFKILMNQNAKLTAFDLKPKNTFEAASKGDFEDSKITQYFPYSLESHDGNYFVSRARGYMNVTGTNIEFTFAVNADDGLLMLVANIPVFYIHETSPGSRVTRKVKFEETGLYPIEIIYYQNKEKAFFEFASLAGVPTNPNFKFGFTNIALNLLESKVGTKVNKIKLYDDYRFFNALDGKDNAECQQCITNDQCKTDQQCSDGLCQNKGEICVTTDKCGGECKPCAAGMKYCDYGQCLQCKYDNDCDKNQACVKNICTVKTNPPINPECTKDTECKDGKICTDKKCLMPPITTDCKDSSCDKKCTENAMCEENQICNLADGKCIENTQNVNITGRGCSQGNQETLISCMLVFFLLILWNLRDKKIMFKNI